MKKISVQVEKYQSYDGSVFDTEQECLHHERMELGLRKVCTMCKGQKKIDLTGDGRSFSTCSVCSGKGWVERKEIWE